MDKIKFFPSLKWQFFVICAVIFLPLTIFSNYILNKNTEQILNEELKNRIRTIATLSAKQISINNLNKIKTIKDTKTTEYKEIKEQLVELKKILPFIKSISIISKLNETKALYLINSNTNPQDINKDGKIEPSTEGLILIGDKNNEVILKNERSLEKGFSETYINVSTYTDKSGAWLSVYAPIEKNKTTLEIEVFLSNTEKLLDRFKFLYEKYLFLELAFILLFSLMISFILARPIKLIKEKLPQIANGEFEQTIKSSWRYGEFGDLIEKINEMTEGLNNYFKKVKEGKIQLEKKLKIIEISTQETKAKNYKLNEMLVNLNSINEFVKDMIFIKNKESLFKMVLPSSMELVDAQKGLIVEYSYENRNFTCISSKNTKTIKEKDVFSLNECSYFSKIFDTKNFLNIDEKGKLLEEEFNSALLFPLIIGKELKAIVCLMNKKLEETKKDKDTEKAKEENIIFIEEEETIVQTLSKLISVILERTHFFELAAVDTLSKLYIRKFFENLLEEEMKKSIRYGKDLSLIMIDIDNLKQCNNAYSHLIGDKVIKEISQRIKSIIKETDFSARYSGDEFIISLTNTSIEETKEIAEKIRKSVESMEIKGFKDEQNIKITISIGVTSLFSSEVTKSEDLIKKVSEELNKSKQGGKNIVTATED